MGADTARRLAARGVTVLAGVRNPAALSGELRTTNIRPVELDVTDDRSVAAAVRTVEDEAGALDVLVNNAGVPGRWAPATEVGSEDFITVFETNVYGRVRVTRAFLPLLRRGTNHAWS